MSTKKTFFKKTFSDIFGERERDRDRDRDR